MKKVLSSRISILSNTPLHPLTKLASQRCGAIKSSGTKCKNKKVSGWDTCMVHSKKKEEIGAKSNKTEKQSDQKSNSKQSTRCTQITVEGNQCQNYTLSPPMCKLHSNSTSICGFENTLSGIPCRNKKSPSKNYCFVHDAHQNSTTPIPGSAGNALN